MFGVGRSGAPECMRPTTPSSHASSIGHYSSRGVTFPALKIRHLPKILRVYIFGKGVSVLNMIGPYSNLEQ